MCNDSGAAAPFLLPEDKPCVWPWNSESLRLLHTNSSLLSLAPSNNREVRTQRTGIKREINIFEFKLTAPPQNLGTLRSTLMNQAMHCQQQDLTEDITISITTPVQRISRIYQAINSVTQDEISTDSAGYSHISVPSQSTGRNTWFLWPLWTPFRQDASHHEIARFSATKLKFAILLPQR